MGPLEKVSISFGWYTPPNAHGSTGQSASLAMMTSTTLLHASNPAPVPTNVTLTFSRPGGSSVTSFLPSLTRHGLGTSTSSVKLAHSSA